ncbi:MAG: helix-turn-helix domain-containing protein [Halobacteriales archaeon]|nr:helix-turn-helix domain-containing protein [Halobacteriales archaeon]
MSSILSYRFWSPELVLAETLADSGIRAEIEYMAARTSEDLRLFIWVADGVEAFASGIKRDPTVTDPVVLSDHETGRLYSLRTTDAVGMTVYPLWATREGETLSGQYEDGWWHSEVRFPTRKQLSGYRTALVEADIEVQIRGIYEETKHDKTSGLTAQQRETLAAAYRNGYFAVPRETTTSELADELGISRQAVSERLRRGYAQLADATFHAE